MPLSEDDDILKFIELYRERTSLWDSTHSEYKNRNKRHDALTEIAISFGVEKNEIEKKIKYLQSHFSRERKKERESKSTGSGKEEIYESKWFAYNSLLFLADKNKPRKTVDNVKSAGSVRRRIAEPGFEDELIQEVRNRPTIWDRNNRNYKNGTLQAQEWDQVAAAIGCARETCKAKWRNMREVFMKAIKNETNTPAHFEKLMFLKEARVKDEISDDDDNDHHNDTLSETPTAGSHSMDVAERFGAESPEVSDTTWPGPTILPRTDVTSTEPGCAGPSRKRRRTTHDTHRQHASLKYAEEEAVESESEDQDMLFLRSLAPYLKHLPPVQKLRLRGKIENLIADEISNYTFHIVE